MDNIKCNVSNCKHNDNDKCVCKLDSIKVSCSCDGCDCTNFVKVIKKNNRELPYYFSFYLIYLLIPQYFI